MNNELKLLKPAEFPALLNEIPGAPKQLYVRGSLPSTDLKWLAVVGSRAASNYGRQVCEHLISGLRGYPIAIVSGLAYGIDAEAHKAALKTGLPTIAIPGSGLDWDVLYPRAHVSLAREIVSAGGALLSEEKPGTKAADWTFPRRNRVMAGLSHATLIIEAKEKSGSLITARLAADYNREVLVVPGSIFSQESRGTHQFLRLGATAITSPEDILIALGINAKAPGDTLRTDVSEDEMRVLSAIASPLSRDELIGELEMDVSEANTLLTIMEIKGLIVEELGVLRAR
jgi:DNA processing protein